MAGFLGRMFGQNDEQKEKIKRIIAVAESQDFEFHVYRQTSIACRVIFERYRIKLAQSGNGMINAYNANNCEAFYAEHEKFSHNKNSIVAELDELRAFMAGDVSSLYSYMLEEIAVILDGMGEHNIATMCRDNDEKLYQIMKNGREKNLRLLQENGLGHLANQK